MIAILALGVLLGMQHALEADHLAAIGAMAGKRGGSRRAFVVRGALWGLGHSITLLAIGAAVIVLGLTLTARMSAVLEFAVGAMLVALGVDVIGKLVRRRIHFHLHDHGGDRHLHAHSHAGEAGPHRASRHDHSHPTGLPLRALVVGLVHGAAGSSALLALIAVSVHEPRWALAYIALFGAGSIAGMAVLSFVAAVPLAAIERKALWLHRGLSLGAGAVAIGLGGAVMSRTMAAAFALG